MIRSLGNRIFQPCVKVMPGCSIHLSVFSPEQRTQMAQKEATIPFVFEEPTGTFHIDGEGALNSRRAAAGRAQLLANFLRESSEEWVGRRNRSTAPIRGGI